MTFHFYNAQFWALSSNCSIFLILSVLVAASLVVPGFSENRWWVTLPLKCFPTLLPIAWQHTYHSWMLLSAPDTRAWAMMCSTCHGLAVKRYFTFHSILAFKVPCCQIEDEGTSGYWLPLVVELLKQQFLLADYSIWAFNLMKWKYPSVFDIPISAKLCLLWSPTIEAGKAL